MLQLSDADLKDMGLLAVGARRKLTAAIHRHKLKRMQTKKDLTAGVGGGADSGAGMGGGAHALSLIHI